MGREILVDARGLEPPEPFEKVMDAISDMGPGDMVLMLLEREPHPLYRVLDRNGYEHHTTKQVHLFVGESFTFRVLDPTAFVPLELEGVRS